MNKSKEYGYLDLDVFFFIIFTLAAVGVVASLGGLVWAVMWLIDHVRFV